MSPEVTAPEGPSGYVWAGCVNAVEGEDHFPCVRCRWIHAKDKAKRDAG